MMEGKGRPWAVYPKRIDIPDHEIQYVRDYVTQRVAQVGDCVEWTGPTNAGGRGIVNLPKEHRPAKRSYYAYRVTWFLQNGDIPDGMHICHRCDNPLCVRVDHLFLGTHVDNMADMIDKRRSHLPFYSAEFQRRIVTEWASGRWDSRRQLAAHFKVSHSSVIKWINNPMPTRPEVESYRNRLISKAPKTFRNVCGEACAQAKLTDAQVSGIRARFRQPGGPKTPSNAKELAAEFGVTAQYVGQLMKGTWRQRATRTSRMEAS